MKIANNSPTPCPTYIFFRGETLPHAIKKDLIVPDNGSIVAGVYDIDRSNILPISAQPLSGIEKLCEDNPKKVLVAPLRDSVNLEDLPVPLVSGKVGIYPDWRYFAIQDIIRPPHGERVYFSQVDEVIAEEDYEIRTIGRLDPGSTRVEFVGSTERKFDPVIRGLRTWSSYSTLYEYAPTGEKLHLIISIDAEMLDRIMAEFRKERDSAEDYGRFLGRMARVDQQVLDFLRHLNIHARRTNKRE